MAWYSGIAKAFGFKPVDPTSQTSAPPAVAMPKPTETVGTNGTAVFGGFIHSAERSADLRGTKRYTTFSDAVLNDDVIGLGVEYFMTLLAGVGWRFAPPDGSGSAGEDIAEKMTALLLAPRAMATPWNRVVTRAGMYRFMGFSLAEWTAKLRDDGLIGYADVESRPQHTIWQWDVDHTGTVLGFWQRSPWDYSRRYLPRGKCAYIVANNVSDSPEGVGLLRYVIETHRQKQRLEQLEGYGFEQDVSGTPVARVPYAEIQKQLDDGKIDATEANKMLSGVESFVENHIKNPKLGLLLESMTYPDKDGVAGAQKMYDLELLQVQASGLPALDAAIRRKQLQIARLLGIEGLMLGASGGSHALSKDKTQNLAQLVTSTLGDIAYAFDADLVVPLMLLNGWDVKLTPTLLPDAVQLRDVEIIVDALSKLAQAALAPDDPAVDAVRDLIGVPHVPVMAQAADAGIGGKKKPPKEVPENDNIDLAED